VYLFCRVLFCLSSQCHRKTEGTKQILYPVNALAFHPRYGTFATGGCDGMVNVWDGANKKRICQYPPYGTSVAALAFSSSGEKLAVAASYTWEEGERDHPNDSILVRTVLQGEVLPKQRQAAGAK
jgi:cell cycle arrest protein BUB3